MESNVFPQHTQTKLQINKEKRETNQTANSQTEANTFIV